MGAKVVNFKAAQAQLNVDLGLRVVLLDSAGEERHSFSVGKTSAQELAVRIRQVARFRGCTQWCLASGLQRLTSPVTVDGGRVSEHG